MKLYPECRFVLCYEGDDSGDTGGDTGDGGNAGGGEPVAFTPEQQERVNKILAKEKREHQAKFEKLEASLTQLAEDKNLSEQDKEKIAKDAEDLRKQLRTRETQAEVDRKNTEAKYKNELEETKAAAEKWESMFKQSTVQRELLDAAAQGDAYEPSQIVQLLQPQTELKEEDGRFKVMINFQDVDEKTGDPIETLRTPTEAVARMKELKRSRNLFNSGVVGGIGGDNVGGSEGDLDVSSLTQEQYRKLRAENPERLGLPPNRRRGK
jgi:hypothetical protein